VWRAARINLAMRPISDRTGAGLALIIIKFKSQHLRNPSEMQKQAFEKIETHDLMRAFVQASQTKR
jgi:hypothetical protein